MTIIDFIKQPWHWSVSGVAIALVLFLLLYTGKSFGVSSTLRTICTISGAGKSVKFFNFDWKTQRWNLVFIAGAIIGGFLANTFLNNPNQLLLSSKTISDLSQLHIHFDGELLPIELFSWSSLLTGKGFISIVIGGFLVGFGARWAGGCTSGHAISGLSNLQLPSLIAVIGFFIGGLATTHLLFPILFK